MNKAPTPTNTQPAAPSPALNEAAITVKGSLLAMVDAEVARMNAAMSGSGNTPCTRQEALYAIILRACAPFTPKDGALAAAPPRNPVVRDQGGIEVSARHPDLARAMRLARISLAFGRVERATRHEDGVRVETDTDHTVMLGLVACELAPPHLDRAMVAAFALVHDLPEADPNAGDTQTLTITPEGMAAKRAREDAARVRITADLGAGSWVAEMMATYEQQQEPEARFVRLLDKVLPKLTHVFNGCIAAQALTDRAGFIAAHERQFRQYQEEYPEFPDALELLRVSMLYAEECWLSAGCA